MNRSVVAYQCVLLLRINHDSKPKLLAAPVYGLAVVGVVGNPIQNKFRCPEKTRFRNGFDKAPFHP